MPACVVFFTLYVYSYTFGWFVNLRYSFTNWEQNKFKTHLRYPLIEFRHFCACSMIIDNIVFMYNLYCIYIWTVQTILGEHWNHSIQYRTYINPINYFWKKCPWYLITVLILIFSWAGPSERKMSKLMLFFFFRQPWEYIVFGKQSHLSNTDENIFFPANLRSAS